MKVNYLIYSSSQSHIQSTEPLNLSTLTMITNAEYSSKKEWANKLKPIPSETNSKAMSSESPAAMTETDLP